MSDESNPDLRFIARQLKQLTTEVSSLRDDMNVMAAMVMRQDHTLGTVLTELRAMHSQHGRLTNRVRELEVADLERPAS